MGEIFQSIETVAALVTTLPKYKNKVELRKNSAVVPVILKFAFSTRYFNKPLSGIIKNAPFV